MRERAIYPEGLVPHLMTRRWPQHLGTPNADLARRKQKIYILPRNKTDVSNLGAIKYYTILSEKKGLRPRKVK